MKAKKYWGQNFLANDKIVDKIIKAADLKPDDSVLEIGPGHGILTLLLANICEWLIAVEIDPEMVLILKKKLSAEKNTILIHGDIIKINLPELLKNNLKNPKKYKVVANIPYYITGPILRLLLESEIPPKEIILMVQKEVAERITARPGKMSLLAVSVQYYSEPRMLFDVFRTSFIPQPEVDSAVIKISNIKNKKSKNANKEFFRIVRAGFSSKRKTLANNLSASFHLDKKSIEDILSDNGFDIKIRAQELSVENWKKISGIINI